MRLCGFPLPPPQGIAGSLGASTPEPPFARCWPADARPGAASPTSLKLPARPAKAPPQLPQPRLTPRPGNPNSSGRQYTAFGGLKLRKLSHHKTLRASRAPPHSRRRHARVPKAPARPPGRLHDRARLAHDSPASKTRNPRSEASAGPLNAALAVGNVLTTWPRNSRLPPGPFSVS